jgi:sugar lactone lactonase YvrE
MNAARHRVATLRFGAVGVLTVLAVACATTTGTPSQTTGTAQATQTPTEPASASLNGCPAAAALSTLPVLARVSGDPDDVVVTPSGSLWLSDRDGGRLLELSASGDVLRTIADPNGPEGIVVRADGKLLVAQQIPNRLDLVDPATSSFSPWLSLGATASPTQGVDGLGARGTTVLIPDSARGRLLTVAAGASDLAGTPVVVATGLGRPVGAVDDGAGGALVVLENTPGLVRVSLATGGVAAVAQFTSLDDVVVHHGIVYVADLAEQSLVAVDPAGGASRALVADAAAPQGLAVLPDGRLLLVDSTTRALVTVSSCG